MIGKMDRVEIAERLGTSLTSLKRAFRGQRLGYHNWCVRQPELVKAVNSYYEEHGKNKTAERFQLKPKQVEHIIYRYKQFKPRQIRWTDKQITEAARMAGLVSPRAQANYFNRPNAHAGAIKSLWMKRFGMGAGSINGMAHWTAKELVDEDAPYIKPIGESRAGNPIEFRRLFLWVDIEKHLKKDIAPFLKDAVRSMADFQRWLHKSNNPRLKILAMIKEREV